MRITNLHLLLCVGLLASCAPPLLAGQSVPDSAQDKVARFVEDFVVKMNKEKSLAYKFKGEFRTLPEDLEKSLLENFPNHRFRVAVLWYSHYSEMPTSLLVVTDTNNGEVLSYCGDIFVFGCDDSAPFSYLLSSYRAVSKKDALEKVTVLSKLIVYPDWRIRRVYIKGKTIYSEFETGLKDPWRILKVSLDKQNRFSRFVIVNPGRKK